MSEYENKYDRRLLARCRELEAQLAEAREENKRLRSALAMIREITGQDSVFHEADSALAGRLRVSDDRCDGMDGCAYRDGRIAELEATNAALVEDIEATERQRDINWECLAKAQSDKEDLVEALEDAAYLLGLQDLDGNWTKDYSDMKEGERRIFTALAKAKKDSHD